MYVVCDICFCNVDEDYLLDHKGWHESLSPAPIPENASGAADSEGVTRAPEHSTSEQDGPVLSVVEGDPDELSRDCDHDWPAELYGHSTCTKCKLSYDQWAYWLTYWSEA